VVRLAARYSKSRTESLPDRHGELVVDHRSSAGATVAGRGTFGPRRSRECAARVSILILSLQRKIVRRPSPSAAHLMVRSAQRRARAATTVIRACERRRHSGARQNNRVQPRHAHGPGRGLYRSQRGRRPVGHEGPGKRERIPPAVQITTVTRNHARGASRPKLSAALARRRGAARRCITELNVIDKPP
jgi:hypothetical protein